MTVPIDQLPVAAVMVAPDGQFIVANELFQQLFGCDASTVPTLHGRAIADPLDTTWPTVHLQRTLAGESELRAVHHRFRRVNGGRVLANLRTSPWRDESGAMLGMIALFTPAATDLPNRYQLLWQALEEQQELMVEWALDGTIEFCNRACREFFGWDTTVVGRQLDEVYDWGERDSRALVVGGVLAGMRAEPQRREYVDGRIVEWVDTAVSDDLGNVVSVFSMGRDITAKVAAERALASSERRFRAMVTNIQDTVMLVDRSGSILGAASVRGPNLGYGDQRPASMAEYVHPDDMPTAIAWFLALLGADSDVTSWLELRARRVDGTFVWLEVAGANLLDDPAVEALVITIRNIDDRKRVEEALAERSRRAEEELRQRLALVAQVGHELRNPLQGIQAFSEVLTREALVGRAGEAADGIARQTRTMRQVVDDLLDASQLGLGMLRVARHRVDIVPLVESAVVDASPLAPPGVVIVAEPVPEHLRMIAGDEVRVRQALVNLLSNACKHTQRGTVTVVVRDGAEPGTVRIAVEDTGTGIRPDDVDRLFRPFERGADARRASLPGIGLGLAIVTGIAHALDGTASAAPREGGGSVFWIELPLAADHTAPIMLDDPDAPVPERRVLVVDDEPLNLLASRFLLGDLGAAVSTATSAEEALALLAEQEFDVVFTDIHLPEMDGYDLTRRIRSSSPHPPVVAVMSGDASDAAHLAAIDAGADLFLPKPTTRADLATALRRPRP